MASRGAEPLLSVAFQRLFNSRVWIRTATDSGTESIRLTTLGDQSQAQRSRRARTTDATDRRRFETPY